MRRYNLIIFIFILSLFSLFLIFKEDTQTDSSISNDLRKSITSVAHADNSSVGETKYDQQMGHVTSNENTSGDEKVVDKKIKDSESKVDLKDVLAEIEKEEIIALQPLKYADCIGYMDITDIDEYKSKTQAYFYNELMLDSDESEQRLNALEGDINNCHVQYVGETNESLTRKYLTHFVELAESGNSAAQQILASSMLEMDWEYMSYLPDYDTKKRLSQAWYWAEFSHFNRNPKGTLLLAHMYLSYDSKRYDYERGVSLLKELSQATGLTIPAQLTQEHSIWLGTNAE